MKSIIVIPSRMASTRFPGKPLAMIAGKPMIQRVWEQAINSNLGEVVVACSENEVFNLIKSLGGKVILTDPDLPSGTDRIHSALLQMNSELDFDCIINLQGDMPLVNPNDIQKVSIPLMQGFDIGTLVTHISKEEEKNINITKAKVNWIKRENIGEAIDFYKKPKKVLKNIYHHIGIYSFRINSLKKFVDLKPSENELFHKLEQWRALDSNMTIGTKYIEESYFGVDTEEDLLKAENIIKDKR